MTAKKMIAVAEAAGCVAGVCDFAAVADRLIPCRALARLPQDPKTVLCLLFPYRVEEARPENLSRYAAVPDYHRTAGAVLAAVAAELAAADGEKRYVPFMDASPIPEVHAAVTAGLGVRGDNGLLISHAFGSFVFIGTVVTDRETAVPAVCAETECMHCGACAAACPSGCLPSADRTRCVSFLTQKKGDLTAEERAILRRGGSLWGCDLCQEVCPMNKGKPLSPHPCFDAYRRRLEEADIAAPEGEAYGWRGKAVLERNDALLKKSGEPF